jgi:HlyD family secretion protein
MKLTRKRIILTGVALLILAALVYSFLPEAIPVQTAEVERAPLRVIVEEEGETRVADRYAITAPVSAYAHRIELEVGDVVERGQSVVQLEPPRTPILDPRSRAEAAATVDAAAAAVMQTEAAAARAQSELERTEPAISLGPTGPKLRASSIAASP